MCDMPMRYEETIAIAALCQAVIAKLYKLHERNLSFRHYSRALLMENKWRAARYGLDGKLIDFGKQTEVPARDLIHEILEFVGDVVHELGSENEIAHVRRMLAEGSGADAPVARVSGDERFEKSSGLYDCRNRGRVVRSACGGTPVNARQMLRALPFDAALAPGAQNAVMSCLRIQAERTRYAHH